MYQDGPSRPDPDLTFDKVMVVGRWGQIDDGCLELLSITAEEAGVSRDIVPGLEM
jgi:hypothetical protein